MLSGKITDPTPFYLHTKTRLQYHHVEEELTIRSFFYTYYHHEMDSEVFNYYG